MDAVPRVQLPYLTQLAVNDRRSPLKMSPMRAMALAATMAFAVSCGGGGGGAGGSGVSPSKQLGDLNEDQLRDIGLSRAEAFVEANKPFWRA